MATTKKPTTKKPAAKKTAVKKLHYGGDSGFPPRRRRTLGDPRRRPTIGRPRRPRGPLLGPDDRPIRAPGIDRPQMPRGRNTQLPANFFTMSPNARKQFLAVRAAKDARRRPTDGRGRQMTPAMRRQMELARRRFNQQRRKRRPTGTPVPQQRISVDPRGSSTNPYPAQKVRQAQPTPRRRPTGTPRGPQVTPRRRPTGTFRPRGNRGRKIK